MFEEPDRRRIYLLRHAEAAYLRDDGTPVADTRIVGLTANGEDQARRQSEVLADVEFDRAVCSGLPRTRATAGFILGTRKAPVLEVVPGLEEIHGGDHFDDISDMQSWIRHVANPWADAAQADSRFLGGERFADFESRVVPAFTALMSDRSWRTLLIVAHGGVNRLLLNHVMNLPWQGTVSIEQDACCINIVDVDMDGARVVRYLVRGVNITGYNLSKRGIGLTDMERAAQRIAAAAKR
ncbi:MAG TPA: histidine phosphatase family protein [Pseudomonadales bacterium]|jgi:broad specificity phosphatase PhoE|nr:histidine phosphatase family protein [Pseudomonadales bacterium]